MRDLYWLTDEQMARLKGRCRIAMRYDRCPNVFFSAICLAAMVMFWL